MTLLFGISNVSMEHIASIIQAEDGAVYVPLIVGNLPPDYSVSSVQTKVFQQRLQFKLSVI